ncbi:MAG: N-acetylmuramic acid 6-phosphate etherase [Anaerolineae bacterium]|nr:N-acetylmuramic acid 6-phosphate etherase [Phycisphaerae bacterium]
MQDRSHLLTEQRLADSMSLDQMTIPHALALMSAQDAIAVQAVAAVRDDVARAIELVVTALSNNGRLFYIGAGTSGRLGVLDASECPPTFRTDPEMIQGIIAGGEQAMFRSQEGAEDSTEQGATAIAQKNLTDRDVLIGIAAGGTTPFVHGALRAARERGGKTVFLTCVARLENEPTVDVVIRPLTGPEVLTGSTRLKAGTATKLILNQITTLAMVQLGKCYENLMVDLRATNSKLWDRGARIVATITGLDRDTSLALLKRADGHVKTAIVMQQRKVGRSEAISLLDNSQGRLRDALNR